MQWKKIIFEEEKLSIKTLFSLYLSLFLFLSLSARECCTLCVISFTVFCCVYFHKLQCQFIVNNTPRMQQQSATWSVIFPIGNECITTERTTFYGICRILKAATITITTTNNNIKLNFKEFYFTDSCYR